MDQTPMTNEHRIMLAMWCATQPQINAESLAGNLMRRFRMDKNTAWILAVRFNNERRG